MNPDLTNDDWIKEWARFLVTLERIFKRKHEILRDRDAKRTERIERLMKILFFLTMNIRERIGDDQLLRLLRLCEEEDRGRTAIAVTGSELIYVNEMFAEDQIETEEDANDGAEAGKTVKDSIEKILKFIPGHKKLLHALNEILSLGRAI